MGLVQTNKWLPLLDGVFLKIKLEILPPTCSLCLCLCFRGCTPIKNAVASGTVVFLMACFALVTQLEVRIYAREILVDLWSWQRQMRIERKPRNLRQSHQVLGLD